MLRLRRRAGLLGRARRRRGLGRDPDRHVRLQRDQLGSPRAGCIDGNSAPDDAAVRGRRRDLRLLRRRDLHHPAGAQVHDRPAGQRRGRGRGSRHQPPRRSGARPKHSTGLAYGRARVLRGPRFRLAGLTGPPFLAQGPPRRQARDPPVRGMRRGEALGQAPRPRLRRRRGRSRSRPSRTCGPAGSRARRAGSPAPRRSAGCTATAGRLQVVARSRRARPARSAASSKASGRSGGVRRRRPAADVEGAVDLRRSATATPGLTSTASRAGRPGAGDRRSPRPCGDHRRGPRGRPRRPRPAPRRWPPAASSSQPRRQRVAQQAQRRAGVAGAAAEARRPPAARLSSTRPNGATAAAPRRSAPARARSTRLSLAGREPAANGPADPQAERPSASQRAAGRRRRRRPSGCRSGDSRRRRSGPTCRKRLTLAGAKASRPRLRRRSSLGDGRPWRGVEAGLQLGLDLGRAACRRASGVSTRCHWNCASSGGRPASRRRPGGR